MAKDSRQAQHLEAQMGLAAAREIAGYEARQERTWRRKGGPRIAKETVKRLDDRLVAGRMPRFGRAR